MDKVTVLYRAVPQLTDGGTGYEISLVEQLAERLSFTPKFEQVETIEEIDQRIGQASADEPIIAIGGIPITGAREDVGDMLYPHLGNDTYLFVRRSWITWGKAAVRDFFGSTLARVLIVLFFATGFAPALWIAAHESQIPASPFYGEPVLFTALYFAVATFSTVGFGDISPVTMFGRTLSMPLMMLANFLLVLVLARLLQSVLLATSAASHLDLEALPENCTVGYVRATRASVVVAGVARENKHTFESAAALVQAAGKRGLDAVVTEEVIGTSLVKSGSFQRGKKLRADFGYSILVPIGFVEQQRFKKAIIDIREDGVLDKLQKLHLIQPPTPIKLEVTV